MCQKIKTTITEAIFLRIKNKRAHMDAFNVIKRLFYDLCVYKQHMNTGHNEAIHVCLCTACKKRSKMYGVYDHTMLKAAK